MEQRNVLFCDYLQIIGDTLFHNEPLAVTLNNLRKLSNKTADWGENDVAMYAWIVDGGGANGMAWLGAACKSGSGGISKTSITRGPSRRNAIIETAEVSLNSSQYFHVRPFFKVIV